MRKRKKKITPAKKILKEGKKGLKHAHFFLIGLACGLSLLFFPFGEEFSPIQFRPSDLGRQELGSVFSSQLPITTPLFKREGYAVAYDGRTRNPYWVYHKVTERQNGEILSREKCEFLEDSLVPEHIRATKKDYRGSGYDRGHLCAAADSPTQFALEETFLLSNISPQDPSFNRGYWKKIEHHIRSLSKEYRAVHVFSGPLYLSKTGKNGREIVSYEVLGPSHVAVPTHFFSLIFVEQVTGKMRAKGYIVPNSPIPSETPLKNFSASIKDIEEASGVIFTHLIQEQ